MSILNIIPISSQSYSSLSPAYSLIRSPGSMIFSYIAMNYDGTTSLIPETFTQYLGFMYNKPFDSISFYINNPYYSDNIYILHSIDKTPISTDPWMQRMAFGFGYPNSGLSITKDRVLVFNRNSAGVYLNCTLTNSGDPIHNMSSDGQSGFGISTSTSCGLNGLGKTTIVVGSPLSVIAESLKATSSFGVVYVYGSANATDVPLLQTILSTSMLNTNKNYATYFGENVVISPDGSTICCSYRVTSYDNIATAVGAVAIYVKSISGWVLTKTITIGFIGSISLNYDGSVISVSSGKSVYIFTKNGWWSQTPVTYTYTDQNSNLLNTKLSSDGMTVLVYDTMSYNASASVLTGYGGNNMVSKSLTVSGTITNACISGDGKVVGIVGYTTASSKLAVPYRNIYYI